MSDANLDRYKEVELFDKTLKFEFSMRADQNLKRMFGSSLLTGLQITDPDVLPAVILCGLIKHQKEYDFKVSKDGEPEAKARALMDALSYSLDVKDFLKWAALIQEVLEPNEEELERLKKRAAKVQEASQ